MNDDYCEKTVTTLVYVKALILYTPKNVSSVHASSVTHCRYCKFCRVLLSRETCRECQDKLNYEHLPRSSKNQKYITYQKFFSFHSFRSIRFSFPWRVLAKKTVNFSLVSLLVVQSPVMNFPPQSHSTGGVGSGNILSKWFSEDVLQQATPAQRHNSPDVTRKVVSVEELERQQAAAIN